jgi:signal transduction histidine kinase
VTSNAETTAATARPRRSIATRARLYLVAAAMLALVVAFGVFVLAWGQYAIGQRTDELSRQVAALAKGQAIADPLEVSAEESATAAARDRLLNVEAGLMGAGLFITDASGNVQRATTDDPPASIPLDRLKSTSAQSGARSALLRSAAGVRLLVVSAPVDATHYVVAVQGLREIQQTQAGILAIGALALLVAGVVAYAAGGVLARRLSAPLVRLETAAESVAEGAFGTQVAEEGDAETASLARSFNRMSTRVADVYSAQKAFVGDVSHEIRTPLTSIRGFAEAMLDGTVTDPDQQHHALTVIHDEAVRIGEVSQTLLALSELEAGAVTVARIPVDTAALAEALTGRFSAPAREAEVRLEVDLPTALRPLGDPDRVLQAVSALVANAIAYTPGGGDVRVSAGVSAGRWRIRVDDSGPGIPAEKRGEVFGRFSRLEGSRGGGAGLGLAICRRVVELMGGGVTVGESESGGARFEIDLPMESKGLNTNSM